MSNQPIQTIGASNDKVKVALAILTAIAGVVIFYVLSDKTTAIRSAALVGSLIMAVVIAWTSAPGRDFLNFSKEALRETKRIVWPARFEALQMTTIVFGFVMFMAIFLWGTDKLLEVVLYNLIWGWER